MSENDEKYTELVNSLFARYDKDRSGALDRSETINLIRETLKRKGSSRKVRE